MMKESNTARGIFTLKDSSGKTIVNVHNMIVRTGRLQIMQSGFPKNGLSVFLGTSNNITSDDMTFDSVKDEYKPAADTSDKELADELSHKLSGTFSIDHSDKYSSGGLIFTDDNGNEALFSRFTCNTINITANKTYSFEYYIYF